jgi:hypothetical protein
VKREIVAEPEIDAFTQERIGGMDGNRETVTPGGAACPTDHLYNDHGFRCEKRNGDLLG